MSAIAAKVTARGLSQADAVGVTQTAILNLGNRVSFAVPQSNGTVVLVGRIFGANKPVLIVNQQGVVSRGVANVREVVRDGTVRLEVSNVR